MILTNLPISEHGGASVQTAALLNTCSQEGDGFSGSYGSGGSEGFEDLLELPMMKPHSADTTIRSASKTSITFVLNLVGLKQNDVCSAICGRVAES